MKIYAKATSAPTAKLRLQALLQVLSDDVTSQTVWSSLGHRVCQRLHRKPHRGYYWFARLRQ